MKKIGLISLAIVLAVGGLGIGYAAWTDTITIDGTVNTGNVDLNIVELSSTLVYKDLDNDGIVVVHQKENLRDLGGGFGWHIVNVPPPPSNGLLVASATATMSGDDTITVTYDNLFPCEWFYVDILLHYDGSIPVKVNDVWFNMTGGDPELAGLDAYAVAYWSDEDGRQGNEIIDPIGMQLHYCDYILVEFWVHVPQEDILMNLSGSFEGGVEVVQWNEYPYP